MRYDYRDTNTLASMCVCGDISCCLSLYIALYLLYDISVRYESVRLSTPRPAASVTQQPAGTQAPPQPPQPKILSGSVSRSGRGAGSGTSRNSAVLCQ